MNRVKSEGRRLRLAATDLSNHVSCQHLTQLNVQEAHGALATPTAFDPLAEILAERGRVHEAAFSDFLRRTCERVESAQDLASPLDLMHAGVDVVLQPWLSRGGWGGRADFLIKVPRACPNWSWSYEVLDTKLATNTRAGAVLQLCVYSDLLADLQGQAPETMHIVKPGPQFPRETYRYQEYAAIYRLLRRDLEAKVAHPADTYPEPCSHCEVCRWRSACEARRRRDDHLSLVADLSRLHRRELESCGITTVTALAATELPWPHVPERGAPATYEKLAQQARLQVAARSVPIPPYELLPVESERGLSRLPQPSTNDVFLDLEGDAFIEEEGREYLFGWYTVDRGYECIWATTDSAERAAFERFIDLVVARWASDPGMHIYHYAAYEPTNLKRLAGRYATRGDELDRLLRGRRLIDLYSVTRESLRAGVESYSIKSLEPIVGYARRLQLDTAGASLRGVRLALQRGLPDAIQASWRSDVEAYNRDDCEAAVALRDWLELRRAELIDAGNQMLRPPLLSGEPETAAPLRSLAARLASLLLNGIPDERELRSDEQEGRWILGHLLEWYRREDKVTWWDYFRLAAMSDAERLDDQRALAGLRHVRRRLDRRSVIDTYEYPAQDVMMKPDEALFVADRVPLGAVHELDPANRTIDVRKRRDSVDVHPTSVFAHTYIKPSPKDAALLSVAQPVVQAGFKVETLPSLSRDLLLRRPPRGLCLPGHPLRRAGEAIDDCALRLANALNGSVLPIQGPPGTGKTETAAKMIVSLVRAGKHIGIAATSHAAIENLAVRIVQVAHRQQVPVRVLLKSDEPDDTQQSGIEYTTDAKYADEQASVVDVVGATAWQWARPSLTDAVDVLFVDEAGQMSLADALSIAASTRSLVLVGDPQQLEQPIQGTHPDRVAVSVLQHMLGDNETIPPDRGLFLEETHRLQPTICEYTSEQFYESRLIHGGGVENHRLTTPAIVGAGLYWLPIEHHGCRNRSSEEAQHVAALIAQLVAPGAQWTTATGEQVALTQSDVLVVAPYNAHVSALRDALDAHGLSTVQVGTVDRFQGRQAAVAIYTMATSTPADAPRGLAFLYDRHRLNVATSRARCAAILACSPELLYPDCQTPAHLHLASALCRFVELAVQLPPLPATS